MSTGHLRRAVRKNVSRSEYAEAQETISQFVHALDLHKTEIKRLRAMVCECGNPEFFPAELHDEGCPARPDWLAASSEGEK